MFPFFKYYLKYFNIHLRQSNDTQNTDNCLGSDNMEMISASAKKLDIKHTLTHLLPC